MSQVNTSQLYSCGCIIRVSGYPSGDKEYLNVKQNRLKHFVKELVLHSSEHLVGVKPCYGKQHASVNILKSVCTSHANDLIRLQKQVVNYETFTNTKLLIKATNQKVSVQQYCTTFYDLCKSFHNILTHFFQPTDLIPIALILECLKSEQLTLNYLDYVIRRNERRNGESLPEDHESNSENGSSQLEDPFEPSI